MAPRICILPSAASSSSSQNPTFITLPHPRTSAPTRYLLHPTKGLHEFTKIPSTTSQPRSWLLHKPAPENTSADLADSTATSTPNDPAWLGNGHILQDGSLFVATPLDPLFLFLPLLLPASSTTAPTSFIPLDDLIDSFLEHNSPTAHWSVLLARGSKSRRQVEARIRAVSDTVDLGDEKACKVNTMKIADLLVKKCEAMSASLPASLEEEFVAKPLVRPVTELQSGKDIVEQKTDAALPTPADEKGQSEVAALMETSKGKAEKPSEPLPTPPMDQSAQLGALSTPPQITNLLRLRLTSQFLSSLYLPPHIAEQLYDQLEKMHPSNELDAYLAELKRLRAEAVTARSGDFSMKRGHEDMEAAEERAEKKRKEEEAKKKAKKNVSKGVRDLSKVNTRGMAKMTSFFKKKE